MKRIITILLYAIHFSMILNAFEISLEYQLVFSDWLRPKENKKEDFFIIDGLDYIDKQALYGSVQGINYAKQQSIRYDYISIVDFTLYDVNCLIGKAYDEILNRSILVKIDFQNKKITPIESMPKKNPEDKIKDIYLYATYGEFLVELFDTTNILNSRNDTYFLKFNYFSDIFEAENMIELNKLREANKWKSASDKYTFESMFSEKIKLQTIQDEKTFSAFSDSFLEDSVYKISAFYKQKNILVTLKDKNNDDILVYPSNFPITTTKNRIIIGSNFGIDQNEYSNFRLYIYHITYDGVVNDDRVRVRGEPNLQSQTLGHVNTGDKIKIIDLSYEKQKIDDMEAYWYKVELTDGKIGWVYGAYVDVE